MHRRDLLVLTLGAALAGGSPCAYAARQGRDYIVLEKPLDVPRGTLVKFFSYGCPFCYRYETMVEPRVLPRVEAAGLRFEPMHVEGRGEYGATASEFFALCLLRDRANGVSPSSSKSLFRRVTTEIGFAYNRRRERWTKGEPAFVAALCAAAGMEPAEFERARSSEAVASLVASWRSARETAAVSSVPAYVVNGRYQLVTQSIKSIEGMAELIEELVRLP